MSVLERCPSYRESNKGDKERQEPTLGVRYTEVSVNRESTVLYRDRTGDQCFFRQRDSEQREKVVLPTNVKNILYTLKMAIGKPTETQ